VKGPRRGPSGYALVRKKAGRTSFQTIYDIQRRILELLGGAGRDGPTAGDAGSPRGAVDGLARHDVKIGHAGTLDRFAEGLLVVLFGSYTRLSDYFMASEKTYEATIRFGTETDTLDPEGSVVATGIPPEEPALREAMEAFVGSHEQVPPDYSAVHVDGLRASERMRKGQSVELRPRPVVIREFELISWEPPEARVRIVCTKGTYIRSLARDLALACGSRAHLSELTRLASGPFRLVDAVYPEDLSIGAIRELDSGTSEALGCVVIGLDGPESGKFLAGKPLDSIASFSAAKTDGIFAAFGDSGGFLGICGRESGKLAYRVVTGRGE